jgi:predicted alpha/beta superfamily hydrolase
VNLLLFLFMALPLFIQKFLPHRQVGGTVHLKKFYSASLGIEKHYNIYLPEGYGETQERCPVVFFLRGHEREWFNPNEDSTRKGRTLKDVADALIESGQIGKMILVGISTASADNSVPCLGVNMLNPHVVTVEGIGTGRYEDYLTRDLIWHIDSTYRTIPSRTKRGIDGFSLGGYTAVMMGVKHPDLFCSVGAYDGTHMWYDFDDTRRNDEPPDDYTWVRTEFFKAAFGEPRDIAYMKQYNPLNLLMNASPEQLRKIKSVQFHILAAAYDGDKGNIERAEHLLDFFKKKGIKNSFSDVKLTPTALHDWHHANLYAEKTLQKHWQSFSKP